MDNKEKMEKRKKQGEKMKEMIKVVAHQLPQRQPTAMMTLLPIEEN